MADKTGGADAPPIAIKQVEQEEDEANSYNVEFSKIYY